MASVDNKFVNDLLKDDFFSSCKHISKWADTGIPDSQPKVQVVTCFLQLDDKFLVLQRARKDSQYGLWGIPGGKLELLESVLSGLSREIKEETGVILQEDSFKFLEAVFSRTLSDGFYGLYLYYAKLPSGMNIPVINLSEHLAYKWVTLEEFEMLDLLHAQREAFLCVKDKLLLNLLQN